MSEEIEVVGFPITGDTNLARNGTHKGLRYKISNHGRYKQEPFFDRRHGTWCYYVYIPEELLPPEEFDKFWLTPSEHKIERSSGIYWPTYDYYNSAWSDAEWHCGVTWYAKLGGHDGAPRCVEIGCDYSHYWDEGHYYNYDAVERDAKNTINILVQRYPFYSRCCYTGKCLPKDQMIEHDGKLYTPEGLKSSQDWDKEHSRKGDA